MRARAVPDRLPTAAEMPRHRHAAPYATLVLVGSYEEAGDTGRHRVVAGDVLIHGDFSIHRDLTGRAATEVLDLPLPPRGRWPARGRVADPDAIVRLAADDAAAAAALLLETFEPIAKPVDAPADLLAIALDDDAAIGVWAKAQGFGRETLSRQFRRLYGIDAATWRAEARARRAWRLIVDERAPLADIAYDTGHADQAHMTRAVKALTGATPGAWRRVTSLRERAIAAG